MSFDELDARMRVFETAHDHCVLPGIWIVARLDGRSFTKLTKETLVIGGGQGVLLNRPFDALFKSAMVSTMQHLMANTGFHVVYGYTESDEISLLLSPTDTTYNRKLRKLNSILAGEASAKITVSLAHHAVFDCRVSQLPKLTDVVDYFRWRQEDATRNALSAHCYWALRKREVKPAAAAAMLDGLSFGAKNEMLYQHGINFNDTPLWQRRGIGAYWEEVDKAGFNPHTNEPTETKRRQITTNEELPLRDDYGAMLLKMIAESQANDHVLVK